jgi:hypothetical protein
MSERNCVRCLGIILLASLQCFLLTADEPTLKPVPRAAASDELKPLNSLIGDWRGVGQLKRGSRAGAWTENATCVWDFSRNSPTIVIKSDGGKQFQELRLAWDSATQKVFLQQTADGETMRYSGEIPSKWPAKLVLHSAEEADGSIFRCTIHQLKDIRATVLLEKRSSAAGTFRRVSEVGYTRSGTQLAVAGANQRKCVVTGGLGTIPVTHNGKTYYVCCQGCAQAFKEAPDAIIAEYQASLKPASKE